MHIQPQIAKYIQKNFGGYLLVMFLIRIRRIEEKNEVIGFLLVG